MRAFLVLVVVCCFAPTKSALSQVVDYSRFALSERAQLSKCFSDMLSIVIRHNLREQILPLLEAGCAGEIGSYRDALRPHWPKSAQQSEIEKWFASQTEKQNKFSYYAKVLINQSGCGSSCMETPTMGIITLISSMEEQALNKFNDEAISVCAGDSCVLDEYRKCLFGQASNEITKRTKPSAFEKIAQGVCNSKENVARSVMMTDFLNAQKRQMNSRLSEATRNTLDDVITYTRHEIVIIYAEDLFKVQPGRKSCKPEMCGNRACLSLDPEPEPEYKCAIAE